MDFLIQFLKQILLWLISWVEWAVEWIAQTVMGALLSILNAIPVPSWIASAGSVISGIPPGVAFFATALQLPQGLSILLGAYFIRFLIRRLPIIG
jgi:hypothetical protein